MKCIEDAHQGNCLICLSSPKTGYFYRKVTLFMKKIHQTLLILLSAALLEIIYFRVLTWIKMFPIVLFMYYKYYIYCHTLHYVTLYCVTLCYVMLYCVVICYMLYHTILYCIIIRCLGLMLSLLKLWASLEH